MRKGLFLILFLLALTATACASDDGAGTAGGHAHAPGEGHGTVPGEAADASDADREVEVVALDALEFDPPSIEVETGEVITFVIENTGSTEHEFVLGDAEYQQAHEEEMAGGGHMEDTDSAVTLAPGETKEITWRFDEAGEVLFGCHEPGHYEGGMVGRITVG